MLLLYGLNIFIDIQTNEILVQIDTSKRMDGIHTVNE